MEILWIMEVITMGFALFLRYVHLRYMTICEKIRLQTWPTRTSVHIYTYLDKHASLIDDMIIKLLCMICLLYERITYIYRHVFKYIVLTYQLFCSSNAFLRHRRDWRADPYVARPIECLDEHI
jgi:hypothetical protein